MRQYLVLTIISLMLILAAILAAIALQPLNQERVLNLHASREIQPSGEATALLSADKAASEAPFTFGEPVESAIFLEILTPKADAPTEFALTTAAIEYELAQHQDWSAQMVCSDHSFSAPLKDPAVFQEFSKDASRWERLIAWMYLSFDRQYHVSLRNSFPQVEEYTLVIGEPDRFSDNLASSTITCEERT